MAGNIIEEVKGDASKTRITLISHINPGGIVDNAVGAAITNKVRTRDFYALLFGFNEAFRSAQRDCTEKVYPWTRGSGSEACEIRRKEIAVDSGFSLHVARGGCVLRSAFWVSLSCFLVLVLAYSAFGRSAWSRLRHVPCDGARVGLPKASECCLLPASSSNDDI